MVITICIGSSCHLKGSQKVIEQFQQLVKQHGLEKQIEMKGSFCNDKCSAKGVNIFIDKENFSVTPEESEQFFNEVILRRVTNEGN